MKFRFAGLSNLGLVRSANQDAYHIDPDGRFFIVADGMGGHAGGEEASRIATEVIQAYLNQHWGSPKPTQILLVSALLQANQAIVAQQRQHPQRADMGTTVVVVVFRDRQPMVAHVGDSRVYRFRANELAQITEDHTWVARAVKLGELTLAEARHHPWRHILSRCLGREELNQIDVQPLNVQSGDRFLLCSDGLTEELADELIASDLQSHLDVEQTVKALVEAALAKGGHDNVTVVVVAID